MKDLIEKVNSPTDLKGLSKKELKEYAKQVRGLITYACIKNGGHLAPSLGAVEICIALHKVLNSPKDKIVFDVGHQAYAHKIITGRAKGFENLRTDSGVQGFIRPDESEHDAFISGHSSNALSAAIGLKTAAKLRGEDIKVACVVGDGALTGGMAFEALNDIGAKKEPFLVVLNDNNMSISENVGAVNNYYSKLRISKRYLKFKSRAKRFTKAIPLIGRLFYKFFDWIKRGFRRLVKTNKLFEQLGFAYYGPFDGNDLDSLVDIIETASAMQGPVLLHLVTKKGMGYKEAEDNPSAYHGIAPIDNCDKDSISFSTIAGRTLLEVAQKNERVVAISAAMADGTGLTEFANTLPERFFDVGIAEQHAVTFAAGLAKGGAKPFVAIYSSFLQRSYDQVLHDVAIDNLPVVFLIDRAGVVGQDGVTHQGVFDISYLNSVPNLTLLAPKDGEELKQMIEFAISFNAPLAIRYPKCYNKIREERIENREERIEVDNFYIKDSREEEQKDLSLRGLARSSLQHEKGDILKWQQITDSDKNVYILAVGDRMLELALKTKGAKIINCRCVKPLDTSFLEMAIKRKAKIITLEDNILSGGFGSSVKNFVCGKTEVISLGHHDNFIHTQSIEQAFIDAGLTSEQIQELINGLCLSKLMRNSIN